MNVEEGSREKLRLTGHERKSRIYSKIYSQDDFKSFQVVSLFSILL